MTDDTNAGYGQAGPADFAHPYNATAFQIQMALAQISTMKVVKVLAVHGGGVDTPPSVDVQPMVNQVDGNGQATPHGTIYNIPVWRSQGQGNAIINDPKVGDIGAMSCSDRDISAVKKTASISTPGSFRTHDAADGVYHGAIIGSKPTQYLFFMDNGLMIVDTNKNTILFDDAGIIVSDMFGNKIMMQQGMIEVTTTLLKVNGAIQATGGIISGQDGGDQINMQTHVHAQPPDSHGDTEQDTGPPIPGS